MGALNRTLTLIIDKPATGYGVGLLKFVGVLFCWYCVVECSDFSVIVKNAEMDFDFYVGSDWIMLMHFLLSCSILRKSEEMRVEILRKFKHWSKPGRLCLWGIFLYTVNKFPSFEIKNLAAKVIFLKRSFYYFQGN